MGKKQSTKQRIIEAAVPMFREKGFENVTIQDICDASSINKHTFYYHFESKNDLLEDSFNLESDISPELFATIINADNYVEKVWIVLQRVINLAISSGPAFIKLSMNDTGEKTGTFKLDRIVALHHTVQPMIEQGKEAGEFLTKMQDDLLFMLLWASFRETAILNAWYKNFDFKKMMRMIYESLFDVRQDLRTSNGAEYKDSWEKINTFFKNDI